MRLWVNVRGHRWTSIRAFDILAKGKRIRIVAVRECFGAPRVVLKVPV